MKNTLNINKMKNLKYKMMRKLAFTLLMLLTLSLNAQVKFLGIPVDGTKSEMISKLQQKGYTICKVAQLAEDDILEGKFNGRDVHISIGTNNNKVYRVLVQDATPMNETDIKIRFNTLVNQFRNNKKYIYDAVDAQYLDDDFDIEYEMLVKNKRISAAFTQKLSEEEIHVLLNENPDLNEYEYDEQVSYFNKVAYKSNTVWFMISKVDNLYWIALFYDNLNNAPNGEDL